MSEKTQISTTTSSKQLDLYGLPLWVYVVGTLILILTVMTNSLPANMSGSVLLLIGVGFLFGKIGDELPIWKDYLGGGALLSFLAASALVGYKIIPAHNVKAVHELFAKGAGALDFFIPIIITSSLLGIQRDLLLKAVKGFIPMVIVGTAVAFGAAVVGGMLVGVPYKEAIMNYALPIMGGGNGAGAIPMSQIWGQVTHKDPKIWYSSAAAILTVANIFAIIIGSLLNGFAKKMPHLSGNGELIKGDAGKEQKTEGITKATVIATMEDAVCGLFVAMAFYAFGYLIGKGLLPSIGGVKIHPYAWMVVSLVIANYANIIPARAKAGLKKVNEFLLGKLLYLFLAGIGITYVKFNGLIAALNLQTVVISLFTVFGAVIGCWLFAKLVDFYEVESAIAAGLCHVNRGGSGDLEVLGASKRMILMPYAQLATRLGGGMILVVASVLFSAWLK